MVPSNLNDSLTRRNRLYHRILSRLPVWAHSREVRSGLRRKESAHHCMWQQGKKETGTETEDLQVLFSKGPSTATFWPSHILQDFAVQPRTGDQSPGIMQAVSGHSLPSTLALPSASCLGCCWGHCRWHSSGILCIYPFFRHFMHLSTYSDGKGKCPL